MSAGVLGVPMTWLVVGSVVWYAKVAGRPVTSAGRQASAVPGPALMIVAKAVAGVPTCTDRLRGSTDAETDCPQLGEANSRARTGTVHRACRSLFDINASFASMSSPCRVIDRVRARASTSRARDPRGPGVR